MKAQTHNRALAVWRADEYILSFLFAIRLQFQLTNKAQLNKGAFFGSTEPELKTFFANLGIKSASPTIKVGNELIFISADHRQDLAAFSDRNKIPVSNRVEFWD